MSRLVGSSSFYRSFVRGSRTTPLNLPSGHSSTVSNGSMVVACVRPWVLLGSCSAFALPSVRVPAVRSSSWYTASFCPGHVLEGSWWDGKKASVASGKGTESYSRHTYKITRIYGVMWRGPFVWSCAYCSFVVVALAGDPSARIGNSIVQHHVREESHWCLPTEARPGAPAGCVNHEVFPYHEVTSAGGTAADLVVAFNPALARRPCRCSSRRHTRSW